jgi:hypothetical protein
MPNLYRLLLATGPKLGAHFPLHPTGKPAFVFNEEGRDCRTVPFDERPQRPRKRLDDHVIAILDDLPADGKGPGDVAAAASCSDVERYCTHNRRPPLPSIL